MTRTQGPPDRLAGARSRLPRRAARNPSLFGLPGQQGETIFLGMDDGWLRRPAEEAATLRDSDPAEQAPGRAAGSA